MKKPLIAAFVVAAVAIGLLIMLLVGVFRVDEDGGGSDGALRSSGAVRHVA